jgi:hypothetical protein
MPTVYHIVAKSIMATQSAEHRILHICRFEGEISLSQNNSKSECCMELHNTKIDISKEQRKEHVEILNRSLADALDLKSPAKQAHWNVKGPSFIALHELFDQVATEL